MQAIQHIKSTVYNIYNHKLTSNYIKHSHFQTSSAIFAIISLCLFTLATVFPLTSAEQRTEAATGTASNTSLTLSTTGGASLDLSVNNSNGTFATTDPTATGYTSTSTRAEFSVTTTNYTGYTLSISASEGDTTGTLVNSVDDDTSTNSIASLPTGSSLTAAEFNNATYNGKWGYKPSKLNSTTNTNYLPAPTTTATTINVTKCASGKSNGDDTCDSVDTYTIDLAARLQYTQNSGTYSKTFILTAVGNQIDYQISYDGAGADSGTTPETENDDTNLTYIILSSTAPTKEGYTFKGWCTVSTGADGTGACTGTDTTGKPAAIYQPGDQYPINQTTSNNAKLYAMWEKNAEVMQNLADALCVANTPTTVKDTRDNSTYMVQRLADGNCWMLDNLALDLSDSAVKANLTSTTTNALDANLANLKNNVIAKTATGGSWTDNYTVPYIATSGSGNAGNWTMDTDATYPSSYTGHTGKIGIYYNYCAASANTICSDSNYSSASYDVCPAGWKLPAGDTGSSSFYQLYNTGYSSSVANFQAALSTPLSGLFYNGSASNQGSGGFWWSSTRDDYTYMYRLYVSTSDVGPRSSGNRNYGFSIRCIKKSDLENDPLTALENGTAYLQDFASLSSAQNTDLVNSMEAGKSYTVKDKRDEQAYTIAKINGKLWMTQNLAYVGDTGSESGKMIMKSTTSNISTNKTLNYNDLTAGNDYSNPRIHDSGNTSYGVYYNYAAASAGTITGEYNSNTQTYDVCPKGWRLPTQGEFSGITGYSSAFSPVKSGYYGGGNAGSRGCWWSATARDSGHRYYLYYDGSSLDASYNYTRNYGLSVRCIHNSQ